MKKLLTALIALAISLIFGTASANNNLNTARWYKVYWSGIHVADLIAGANNNRLDTVIRSYGIVQKVSQYSSRTSTVFNIDNGQYVPLSFYTEFQQRSGARKIDIKYSGNGTIVEEAVTPPDNRAKRPAVAETLKKNAVDPLTAFMIARQEIKNNLAKGNNKFSLDIYDGRRLSRLDFDIYGRMQREIEDKKYNVVKVTFKRQPVAGYTKNELRRAKDEEPLFTLYISDDETFLPIKADAEAPLGTAVLLLEKECESVDSCVN